MPESAISSTTPALDVSDETLAARVQGGCVRSYEQLDRRYRVRLIHLLRRRVGREADAEDLAQITLWTAYEKIGRYDPSRRFSTWLFTIAVRKAIDHGRSQARRTPAAENISRKQIGRSPGSLTEDAHAKTPGRRMRNTGKILGGDATAALADARPGPLEQAIRAEESDRSAGLWQVADEVLKPAQWTALWLHYGEDQTPAEVAKAMGIPRVNARVLLHRARKALGQALRQRGEVPRAPTPTLAAS
jgi:RNA polymerase sigma-70 factor (ECF subfamily)